VCELTNNELPLSLVKLIGIIPEKSLMVYLYALFIAEIIDCSLKISYLATIKHKGRF
jgi:hypothetical protein